MTRVSLSILLLIRCFFSFSMNDCDKRIIGIVLDQDTNEPIPFATVMIVNSTTGTVSQEDGTFILEGICENEIDFEVRFVGFKAVTHHHDFRNGQQVAKDHIVYLASVNTELESITVENERLDELKSLAIQNKELSSISRLGTSIVNMSKELTGISLLKAGSNISKPIVHGLHSNRVLLINDGLRQGYQAWGEEHGPEIDPSHVDLIEVVKGAGTVKYGPDALGGVVLYNAKRPRFGEKLNGAFGSSFQTNGRAVSGQLDLAQGFDRFAWKIGGHGIIQGDLQAPDYNLSNTGKEEYGLSFNTLLHRPSFDLQVAGSYFDQQLGILRASIVGNLDDLDTAINRNEPDVVWPFTYDLQSPRQDIEHAILKANLSWFLGEHAFKFQYGAQRNNRQEFDVRRGELNDRPVINLRLLTHSLDMDWIQPTKGNWRGSTGVQLVAQNSVNKPETNPINFIPDYEIFNFGLFTIQSYEMDNGIFEMGIRHDFQSLDVADTLERYDYTYSVGTTFSNTTYTFGLRRNIGRDFTFSSNIGFAWRPPNVAELYSFGYRYSRLQFGFLRYNFNPKLVTPPNSVFDQAVRDVESERGLKWISGLKLRKKRIAADFIFYINQINNYIFLRPYGVSSTVAGVFPFFLYEQTDAVFYGADWDVAYEHAEWIESVLKLSYVYARSIAPDQALLEIPPLNASYSLKFSKRQWNIGLHADYTAQQWNAPPILSPGEIQAGGIDIDRNTVIFDFMEAPDDYLLLGVNISYKKDWWNFSLSSNNLLNTSYRIYTDRLRYFADAPGRNFSFAFELNF